MHIVMADLKVKRVYLPAEAADGHRILIDRLWPRGLSKEVARVDEWRKEVSPSAELRRWFGHKEENFGEFVLKYVAELDGNPDAPAFARHCRELLEQDPVTLLYGARNKVSNHALVLRDWVNRANSAAELSAAPVRPAAPARPIAPARPAGAAAPELTAPSVSPGPSLRRSAAKTVFRFEAVLEAVPKGGAFVRFPHDVRKTFGKGRVFVHATFDGVPYDGSLVNMGVKNSDGSVCHILGVLKSIRESLGKQPGDTLTVTVQER